MHHISGTANRLFLRQGILQGVIPNIRISPSYRFRLLPILRLSCYSQGSTLQLRRTNKPRRTSPGTTWFWDEQCQNPTNNMAASIGTFQK